MLCHVLSAEMVSPLSRLISCASKGNNPAQRRCVGPESTRPPNKCQARCTGSGPHGPCEDRIAGTRIQFNSVAGLGMTKASAQLPPATRAHAGRIRLFASPRAWHRNPLKAGNKRTKRVARVPHVVRSQSEIVGQQVPSHFGGPERHPPRGT